MKYFHGFLLADRRIVLHESRQRFLVAGFDQVRAHLIDARLWRCFAVFGLLAHAVILAAPAQIDQPLALSPPRRIFRRVTLEIDPLDNEVIDAPRRRGRSRALTNAERHAAMLRAAFAEISKAKPERLREIIVNAQLFVRLAKGRGDPTLEQSATAIKERATRRLHWFRRQGDLPDN